MNLDNEVNFSEIRNFPEGYGKFPYLIVRIMSAVYMQVPIHLKLSDPPKTYGVTLEEIEPWMLELYEIDKNSKLHDLLIERTHEIKELIESQQKRPANVCLVEGPEMAYYLAFGKAYHSKQIPSGGSLVTQDNKVIAMNVPHYLE